LLLTFNFALLGSKLATFRSAKMAFLAFFIPVKEDSH
jgi:hypothetical protein